MKVHKIVLFVVDFDEVGQQGAIEAIENAHYPNRCISPRTISAETADCGDWSDDHPLNKLSTEKDEIRRLFG